MKNLSVCPYYQHFIGKGPMARCTFGCWEEPRCVTEEPLEGWPQRHTERGPDGRFRKVQS